MPEWPSTEWILALIEKGSRDFHSQLFWFVTSIVASYFIIPRAIEARQKRALHGARAIVLNRSNQLHQAVAAYARALIAFSDDLDHSECEQARNRVTSIVRHFRRAAEELSPVLRGNLGASYYAYRLDITALLGELAHKFGDYREREIQTVMMYDPPGNRRFTNRGSVIAVDGLFRRLRRACGRDLHFSSRTWSGIGEGWSAQQIQDILDALNPEGLTAEQYVARQSVLRALHEA